MKIGIEKINNFNDLANIKIGTTILVNGIKLKVVKDTNECCNIECWFFKTKPPEYRKCTKFCLSQYRIDNIQSRYEEIK